jgi:uncharacterized membrane protein YjjB (DUF3815 family)
MDLIFLLKGFVFSTIATCFFGLIFRAPGKTIPFSAAVGSLGWVLLEQADRSLPAYFVVTAAITIFGECLARLMKKPANSFIYVMLPPMVPGVSLYRTMLHLTSGRLQEGMEMGAYTTMSIGMIAMAIGFTSLVVRRAIRRRGPSQL